MTNPKTVLMAHNFYSSHVPSGENRCYNLEKSLLEAQGIRVVAYEKYSDELSRSPRWGKIFGGIATPWNPTSFFSVRNMIRQESVDLLHVHNFFPLISPAVFHAARNQCPSVLTLHNYRIYCAAAIPMRQGSSCFECLEHRTACPSLVHGCYRNSRIATIPLATMVGLHRRLCTWEHYVDAFIVLSNYQKQIMIDAGLPANKVYVKPHFYPERPVPLRSEERGEFGLFVGRLSEEKGISTLVKAWRNWGEDVPELRVIGDGPMRVSLEKQAIGLPIRFLGQLSVQDVHQAISRARALILPSECTETFGLVLLEAKAHATPVIVSDLNPLSSIVSDGITGRVFKPGDAISLLRVLKDVWSSSEKLERLGKAAHHDFEKNYTSDRNYDLLINIYAQARLNFLNSRDWHARSRHW